MKYFLFCFVCIILIFIFFPKNKTAAQENNPPTLDIKPSPISKSTKEKYSKNRIIVKYKKGESKTDLKITVEERSSKKGIESFRQQALDTALKIAGKELPEEKLKRLEDSEKKYDFTSTPIFKTHNEEEMVILETKTQQNLNIQNVLDEFKKLPEVESASFDYKRELFLTPNDTYYPQQWALTKINAPSAWDVTTGDTTNTVYIAVIDTGVDLTHPEFTNKIQANYGCTPNCISGQGNDIFWHGTHVAGIAAANPNNGQGIAGVGYNTKIISLRVAVFDAQSNLIIDDAYIISAINNLINNYANKNVVINLSLGGTGNSSELETAINNAWAEGFIIVASAGNCGNNTNPNNLDCNGQTNPIMYPAAYQNVIAVAASTNNDQKSSYSEFGSWVDVSAPGGDNCTGTVDCIASTYPDFQYAYAAGTSMASPHAAGIAALVWSRNTNFSNQQVRNIIESSSNKTVPGSNGQYWQFGRVDAYQAVLQAASTPTPTPPPRCTPIGDLNCSGKVNILDLSNVLSLFGTSTYIADLDNSGTVNLKDISILLGNFGKSN